VYVPAGEVETSIAPLGVMHEVRGEVLPVMVRVRLLFGTETVVVAVQPLDDEVTVTEYVPAGIFERSSEVLPLDQIKVYAPGGVTLRSTAPLLSSHKDAVMFEVVVGSTMFESTK
jgi:hypothetical protein